MAAEQDGASVDLVGRRPRRSHYRIDHKQGSVDNVQEDVPRVVDVLHMKIDPQAIFGDKELLGGITKLLWSRKL